MLENIKRLFDDFDFSLPTGLNDIGAGFVGVVVSVIALTAIIISICVLSKKKRLHISEKSEAQKAQQPNRQTNASRREFIPEDKNREIKEKFEDAGAKTDAPAIGREVSYAADFAPQKQRPAAPVQPPKAPHPKNMRAQANGQAKKKDIVSVRDGFVVINSAQREKLENAYSAALRKCAVNGTSDDLEKLLDAKRLLGKPKIPQREFEALLKLLFPKMN